MAVGDREYHRIKSREWFERAQADPEKKLARNRYRTQQRRDKKSAWVQKFGGKCADCSGVYPDPVFEFHHIDPSTKAHHDNAKIFMFSDVRIEEELKKCVMLCANCHRLRHIHQAAA
jgi:hypothetical protein